ncbi:hypothetical protein SAMN05216489_00532 [Streptomyces sp. 3213]|uniref:ATP-binding protein n=1 Tax=Streptomyces sp. 3213.3 TaxID=1855348 RepID=UPI0008992924|nr:ATP-binding protein [Streptomyces sp. 3213.3]SEC36021.1 hypothetical protein SAMN05216489_00532 [Streptomyces sp. 3213] [Streptomyces sp. 3213.3]
MGKSRLVREATAILKTEGWRVVTGFCCPLREPLPYGPVVDALGKVGPWLPATGPPRCAAPPVDPGRDAVGRVIPVVEDLHWADDQFTALGVLCIRRRPTRERAHLPSMAERRISVSGSIREWWGNDTNDADPQCGEAMRHASQTY